jgi:hypothetical protein
MKTMFSRMLGFICLALLFGGLFSGFVTASVEVSLKIELDPDEIDPGDSFNVKLNVTNTDNEDLEDSDGVELVIYVDGVLVHEDEDWDHGGIPQSSSKTVSISSNSFNTEYGDVWEKSLLGYECEKKTVEVRLSGDVSDSDKATLEIDGEDLYVGMTPSEPTAGSEIVVEVEDEDDLRDNVNVRITHLGDDGEWDMDDVNRGDETDGGEVKFRPLNEDTRFKEDPYAKYQLDVWDDNYCLFRETFDVGNKLKIADVPVNPYAGEEMTIRVLDVDNDTVENAKVTVSGSTSFVDSYTSDSRGYVRFAIDSTGTYTLIASKTGYGDSDITTINVKNKEGMDIGIEPTKQAIGKDVTITVTSKGSPINGAEVTIKKPDGTTDVLSTPSTGKVIYTPTLTGTYDVTVKKVAYETTTSSFKAINLFDVTMPDKPGLHEEIQIEVKDQNGNPVPSASITITGTDITGLTGSDGRFTFMLENAGKYTMTIKKTDYEDFTRDIEIRGNLQLEVTPEILDLEDSVTIEVRDENGQSIEANIEMTKPDGKKETVVKNSHAFTPELAGKYDITASKDYYVSASSSFSVNPYPLNLDVWLSGTDLMVKATSNGNAIQGSNILVSTPGGDEITITTDDSGIAKLELKDLNQTGTFVVSSLDINFEKKTVTKEIESLGGGLMSIVLIVGVIVVLIILVSIIFYISHKKGRRKEVRVSRRRKGARLEGL